MNDEDAQAWDDLTGSRASFLDFEIDWRELYGSTTSDGPAWLVEPLLAAGRAHALYAPAKAGKSLLALYVAAGIATGRQVLERPSSTRCPVIYCDYEMTREDILERLEDMGYDDPDELDHLHYVQMPNVAALNTGEGGEALVEAVTKTAAQLVVIDTTGRAVDGAENDADTYMAFFRYTGRRLKGTGCTWMRLDHAGKNLERGQRGTSAKNDDVDIVWQLTRTDQGVRLVATHRRMGWVPTTVDLRLVTDPVLAFSAVPRGWPAGTTETAELLHRLGIPVTATNREARAALRAAGESAGNDALAAAVRYRRSALWTPEMFPEHALGTMPEQGNNHAF